MKQRPSPRENPGQLFAKLHFNEMFLKHPTCSPEAIRHLLHSETSAVLPPSTITIVDGLSDAAEYPSLPNTIAAMRESYVPSNARASVDCSTLARARNRTPDIRFCISSPNPLSSSFIHEYSVSLFTSKNTASPIIEGTFSYRICIPPFFRGYSLRLASHSAKYLSTAFCNSSGFVHFLALFISFSPLIRRNALFKAFLFISDYDYRRP